MSTEYIGIDLHKAFFQVCAKDVTGATRWEERWARTAVGIAAFRERCSGDSCVAVEASGPTWSFVDQIVSAVGQVQVIDARKTRLRAGYAAKTDRLDARRLADALRRQSVVAVYIPPPAIRQLRELCRYRATLLLLRQGLAAPRLSDLFGAKGRQWLTTVTIDGWAGDSFRGLYALYQTIDVQLAPVEHTVQQAARRDPIVRALDQIPGIAEVLGLMIRAEIGSIRRFAHSAQLASYAGLVPRVMQSGTKCVHGPITREGSPWLRWALIEAATHGTGRRDAVGRWARRLALRKGALKARAAIARRLSEEVFRTWYAVERLSGSAVETPMTTRVVVP